MSHEQARSHPRHPQVPRTNAARSRMLLALSASLDAAGVTYTLPVQPQLLLGQHAKAD